MEGFDIDWIMDLDILSFDSLIGSIYRIQSQHTFEDTHLMRAATQAKEEDFKKVMAPYQKAIVAGTTRPKPGTKGAKDFMRKHRRGI